MLSTFSCLDFGLILWVEFGFLFRTPIHSVACMEGDFGTLGQFLRLWWVVGMSLDAEFVRIQGEEILDFCILSADR